MSKRELEPVLKHIRNLVADAACEELSDLDLLERFTHEHEELVFETLLRRHGPLVLNVCRRVLQHDQDAEDVFQATFLVLARNARSIRKGASLGSWLYGVAYRLALKAKATAARRRAHERRLTQMAPTSSETIRQDIELGPLLDEELHRLPEQYRAPLILCYLEGKTNVEAAGVLGWAPGSMSKRLLRGRELLRDRLLHRGIALSSAALVTLLESNAQAAVPPVLLESSLRAAILVATGKTAAGVVSTQVLQLAEGVLHTMFSTKLKVFAALVLSACLLAASSGLLSRMKAAANPDAAASADDAPLQAKEHPRPELALVPGNAMAFAHISIRDVWETESIKKLRVAMDQSLQYTKQDVEKRLGVALSNLDSITLIMFPPLEAHHEPTLLAAFTTLQPYSRQKITAALVPGGEERELHGKPTIFSKDKSEPAVSFVTDRIFLVGLAQDLGFSLGQGERKANTPIERALKLAVENHSVAAGFHMPDVLAQALKQAQLEPSALFLKPLTEIQSGTLVLDLGSVARFKAVLNFPDAAAARSAAEAVRTGQGVLKGMLKGIPKEMFPSPPGTDVQKELLGILETLQVTRKDEGVQLTMEGKSPKLLATLVPAIERSRKAAQEMARSNNLKQVALAMHNYHSTYGHLPGAAIRDKNGKPLLSWRVAVLPFLDQVDLYNRFKLDEPWNSERNLELLKEMPRVYRPANMPLKVPDKTFYQVFTGKGTPFENDEGQKFEDITDGTSNTILAIEAGDSVPWTKPEDLTYAADKPLPKLGGLLSEVFLAVYCDGSVHPISRNVNEQRLRALITRNGGEKIDP
ncbi:MAG TPA: sigma-70 family RNA polymerase sigma factor [Gemmataceae bacterium]|nr:sigma-70 family RNA polymerase sigma factor [Gemmataceae bacterium]